MALYASEKLVQYVSGLAHDHTLSAGLVGLIVALGADAPEVTSALIALAGGSTGVGLGVVLGSNIYNLAALLGFSAIVVGGLHTGPYRLTLDGGVCVLLAGLSLALLFIPTARVPLALVALLVLAAYGVAVSLGPSRVLHALRRDDLIATAMVMDDPDLPEVRHSVAATVALGVVAVAFIVAGSELLVRTSLSLGPRLHVPDAVIGTFVLAVATSLPNTWAAVSLARRGHASAAVASAFNSNSINVALGAGLPSLFISLHASHVARVLDAPWMFGMTAVAVALLATRQTLSRLEGGALLGIYCCFVGVRLAFF
jgi:cation:H+ antiporter